MLDTRSYVVRLPDGSHQDLSANLIAQNLYSNINEHGHRQQLFKEIVGLRQRHLVTFDDQVGTKRKSRGGKTTRGWEVQVEWCDGTCSWIPMNEVRQSHPVDLAEYVVLSGKADLLHFPGGCLSLFASVVASSRTSQRSSPNTGGPLTSLVSNSPRMSNTRIKLIPRPTVIFGDMPSKRK